MFPPCSGDEFRCELWKAALPGSPDQWLIAKPQTFMNLSGECVQSLAAWHVFCPRISLSCTTSWMSSPGRMKYEEGRGRCRAQRFEVGYRAASRHAGLSTAFASASAVPPHGGEDTVNWVLARAASSSRGAGRLPQAASRRAGGCPSVFAEGNVPAAARAANAFVIE